MLADAGLTHMVWIQDWHQTFEITSTRCCSVFPVTFARCYFGDPAPPCMNCENDFGCSADGLFDLFHKRHAICVGGFEPVIFQPARNQFMKSIRVLFHTNALDIAVPCRSAVCIDLADS